MTGTTAGQIQIMLKMVDQASGPMNQAAATTEQASASMRSSLGKLALAAGTVVAANKLREFAMSSIDAASDLNESMNKVQVVFGQSAQSVIDFSKNADTALGQSQQQALEAASTFGNLFLSLKLGQQQTADMSTTLVQLASDLASFNNVDPTQVLEDLRSGLVGQVEPLRKYGILLSQAAIEQQAMDMGLVSNAKNLTQAQKLQATYALILAQTGTAQGDFARTSNGLANSSRILAASWTDLKARLGTALLPAVTQVVQVMARLMAAIAGAPPEVQKMVAIILVLTTGLLAATPVMIGFGAALDVMLGPVGLVVLGITGLIAVIALLATNWDTITAKVPELQTALDGAKVAFSDLVQVIQFGVTAIMTYYKLWWDTASNLATALIATFTGMGEVIKDVFTLNWRDIGKDASDAGDVITQAGRDLASNFQDAAKTVVDAGVDMVTHIADAADRSDDSLQQMGGAAEEMAAGVYSAATGMAQAADTAALSWDALQKSIDTNASNAQGAVSQWTTKLNDAKSALKILDDQKASGEPLNDKQVQQYQDLTWYVGRLQAGIKDDLNPAVVDAQDKAAQFMKAQDDLNAALANGSITQDQYNQAILDAAANADPATAATYGLTGAQNDLIKATKGVVDEIKAVLIALGLIPADTDTTITANTGDAQQKLDTIQGTINGIPTSFTVTAYANIAPATNEIYALGKLIPHSPAEEGPFSKLPNWDWVFSGISDSVKEQTKESEDAMAAFDSAMQGYQVWNFLLGGLQDIVSGKKQQELQDNLALLANQLQLAIEQHAPQAIIDGLQQAIGATKEQMQAVGSVMGSDIVIGMQQQIASQETAKRLADAWQDVLSDPAALISGDMLAKLQDQLATAQQQLVLARATGQTDIAEQAARDIRDITQRINDTQQAVQAAADAGLIPAARQISQDTLDALTSAFKEHPDEVPKVVDQLVSAIQDGALTIDQALSILPKDTLPAFIDALKQLEQQVSVQLAQSILTGADNVDELNQELQLLDQLLGTVGASADAVGRKFGDFVKGFGYYISPGHYSTSNPLGSGTSSGSGLSSGATPNDLALALSSAYGGLNAGFFAGNPDSLNRALLRQATPQPNTHLQPPAGTNHTTNVYVDGGLVAQSVHRAEDREQQLQIDAFGTVPS